MAKQSPRLPQGPPPVTIEVRLTPRELEFIDLRYGQEKTMAEIAETWKLSRRTVQFHSSAVMTKLGICRSIDDGNNSGTLQIQATKKLLKLGLIQVGDV